MATKDWKKDYESKDKEIITFHSKYNGEVLIQKIYDYKKFLWMIKYTSGLMTPIKILYFKTKFQALKFAKNYMRTN